MKTKSNFNPRITRGNFQSKNWNGNIIINEQVWFIPSLTIECNPPYIAGQQDTCWVKYRYGNRPKNKKDWQNVLGMSIETMI